MSTSALSGWIITVLSLLDIDTTTFTSHSTGSALSCKAKASGVPIAKVLRRRYWSGSSTFENFNHKEILPEEVNFRLTIQKSFEEWS